MAEFTQAGVAVFAISYDTVEVLADFANKRGITFPLLSDEGSKVIRQLGLYNEHLAEQAQFYGREPRPDQFGVPYPGVFHLDADGVVIDRQFEQSYRVRPSPVLLLEDLPTAAPLAPAVTRQAAREGVLLTVSVDEPTYRPYELHELMVTFGMDDGVHVYGATVPPGFTALEVTIQPFEGLEVESTQLPEPTSLQIAGINETFLVYEGQVTAVVRFNIVPYLETATLRVAVRYQACTDRVCYQPDVATFELELKGVDLIRD